MRNAETWAALSAVAMLATVLAFVLGKVMAAVLLGGIGVTLAVVTILAALLDRQEFAHRAITAEAEAKRATDMERRVLSVLNHDLAQPLHAISLYHSALRKRVTTDDARGVLDKAENATHALADMLAALGDFSRINTALAQPQIETFSLQEALAALPLPTPQNNLRVFTDRALLIEALTQLVRNAEQHGGGGRIEIRDDEREREVEITIIDAGAGIAAEDQRRIFEPFERLAGARSGKGLGLGLTIAQRISDALNLSLQVQSDTEKGARFSLRVPLDL